MDEFLRKQNQNIKIVLLVAAFFVLGIYIGYNDQPAINKVTGVSGIETPSTINADFSPFWKVWNIIDEKSIDASQITAQDKVYGAISGLMSSLNDPYSEFFDPQDTKLFEDEITGSFGGIGLEIGMKNNILTVVAPLKDTPAYNAGIKTGDEILKINSITTQDMTIDQAISLIRGDKGTTVTLTILRSGETETRTISVVRDIINAPTLDTEMRPDGIFVIRLYTFSENSSNLFATAIKQFAASGSNKLILDLRGNPGGYLDDAVDIASWFLPSNKIVVTEDYGAKAPPQVYMSKGYNIFGSNLKFVILIDGGSASASEIVSGAMQDNGRAKLVGSQSYGKGSVQEVEQVTPDTILKITVAKWLTPNGTSISEKGLTPDYKVDLTEQDVNKNIDPQMDKAVEVLDNWPDSVAK